MPATYSKKAKPTPPLYPAKPQKPKPVECAIMGIPVDPATYKKYSSQTYTVCFVRTSLEQVEKWATDPERARKHPDAAAEANRILQGIITEIKGKEDKPMTTPKTAADFIDALNDIFTESRNAYADLQSEVDTAAKKLEQARAELRKPKCNQTVAEARITIATGELRIAEDNRRTAYQDMLSTHNKKVAELRERFAAHLEEHYSASPDKLDNATMQLLSTGICTPSELSRLVDRHQGNPTMLRILGGHARKLRDNDRHMSAENRAICTAVVAAGFSAKDGSRELEIFDTAVSTLAYGLDKNAEHAARMAAHVPGWMDGYKAKMDNLPVIPEEMAPAPKADSTEGGNE